MELSQLRYRIQNEDGQLIGSFRYAHGLDGFRYVQFRDRETVLLSFEMGQLKQDNQTQSNPLNLGYVTISMLAGDGALLMQWDLEDAWQISAFSHQPNQVDELVLVGNLLNPLEPQAWRTLQSWCDAPPTVRNQWAPLSTSHRRGWLIASLHANNTYPFKNKELAVCNLDGQYVTDYPSAFIALGEAINGPGGYFGRNVDALSDCLCGGFGVEGPFVLRWHNSGVARHHLTAQEWRRESLSRLDQHEPIDPLLDSQYNNSSLWNEIIGVLKQHSVEVHLL